MSEKNLVTFFDTVGRTIIGEKIGEDDSSISIKNPAVVNIVEHQQVDPTTGQAMKKMALQLFPAFFREFLADKTEDMEYSYVKSNVTLCINNPTFDYKLAIQYDQLFASQPGNVTPVTQASPVANPEENGDNTIKLFD